MPKIVFRADAEKSIGTGDLKSLIYLAREFYDNSWKCFFIVKDYKPAKQIINMHHLKNVTLLPHDINLENEINFIRQFCIDNSIDCLFMEITKRSLVDYESLGKPTSIKACVNFNGVITDDFDLVVNWSIANNRNLYNPSLFPHTRLVLGFENIPLPISFSKKKIISRANKKNIENILITMGGTDEFDMTRKVLEALVQLNTGCRITIIVGPAYQRYVELSHYLKSLLGNFVLKHNVENMFKEYTSADIAVSAGGLTSIELAAAKTPALLIATYQHQRKRCEYLSENFFSYYLGYYKDITVKDIISGFKYLTANLGRFKTALEKSHLGNGSKLIYDHINNLLAHNKRRLSSYA